MQVDRLPQSYEEFKQQWHASGEATSDVIVDVAWRRYRHVHAAEFKIVAENDHPSLNQLNGYFELLLNQPGISGLCSKRVYLTLQASDIPWTPTSIQVKPEQPVTIFATGRTWRSKILDLYLPPHFNLWHRIGVNGSVFNSTHDTKTFNSGNGQSGELFVANQFPGGFHDRGGGRLGGNLSIYDKAEGAFQIVIIQWNEGMTIYEDVKAALEKIWDISHDLTREGTLAEADPYKLLFTARQQLTSNYFARYYPADWSLLWFLGLSEIFFQEQFEESTAMIRCLPNGNVGILQKDLLPTVPLRPTTTTSWSWNITALPSRLREDTTLSHDYLSLAFEFENGRDLTYTWSWELPCGFGYWCPLAAWCDREYHVVIRSGTQQLGQWLDEQRNVYRDYVEYVNAGDSSKYVPEQIVRVWLIAGNRWQRYRGEMLIKNIALFDEDEGGEVTLVL